MRGGPPSDGAAAIVFDAPGVSEGGGSAAGCSSSPRTPQSARSVGSAAESQFTFKPEITRRAAARKPRPLEDMSEGERLRRAANLVSSRCLPQHKNQARRSCATTLACLPPSPHAGAQAHACRD